ncbi:hypothetical protein F3Y22_tig00109919pilonHSYRG00056 [Hibiscus syriacus]|uniref:CCHC-type domain-containing protein n=1 Tax=Hibiscus syriacus TaxID=106335 RepID=A0A6A3BT49_HIBSY|nr:hypothetical protein F3Y22_tig00109919pilonHSYRG00056 [Hibiscus syriacus]
MGGLDDTAAWDGGVQGVATDEESDSEEQSVDSMDVPYLSDDEGDDELKYAREKNKGKKHVDEGVDEGGNNGVTEDVSGNDTDYYDSDDHGSLIMSDDDEHEEDELRSKNPGSTIKMAVNKVSDNSPPHFKRFYVCFDAMKRGWKEGCKSIIGVDGCFLKGLFKGILLSTIGRDANDQMYLITWVVVEGESTYSWSWFLNIVAADLGLDDGFGYTIISDQHKSTTEREWEENKDALPKIDIVLTTELFCKKEKMWTKAFQMMHFKSDIVDNNCEAFNSSIVDARSKSIITMLDEIRVKIMTRIVEKRRFLTTWKYNFGPLFKKKFDIIKKDNIQWKMIWNGDNGCEVKKGNKQYIVYLNEKTYEWIHSFYHKDIYIKEYKYALQPINGPQDWKKYGIEQVLPPVDRDMPGRPKKNRRKQKDEPKKVKPGHVSRIGLIMTCKRCGGQGHNKRSCTTNQDLNIDGNSSIRSPSTIDSNPTHSGTRAPKKRKGTEDHSGTQESVAPKKKK